MDLLLSALLNVFVESAKEADLVVNHGVEPKAVYERQCKGLPAAELLRCSEEVKAQRGENEDEQANH